MVLGGWAGGKQGASFNPQPCAATFSVSYRSVSFLLFFVSAVGLALTWVTPKLIKRVPLAPRHPLQGSSKPRHPSRCLRRVASCVYLLMDMLQLWRPLLLSELMNNEMRSNRKKWEKKELKLRSLSIIESHMGFPWSSRSFYSSLRWPLGNTG